VYFCWKFDWVERSYECSRCSKNIKLFWHPEVHKHHDYATLEEIENTRKAKILRPSHPEYARRMVGDIINESELTYHVSSAAAADEDAIRTLYQ
jgi:DNA-directed RNA polymerase subunit RPC12/RpoP